MVMVWMHFDPRGRRSLSLTRSLVHTFSRSLAQVAAHDAPIRNCRWVNQANGGGFLATAGWDKTLKYWDLRTPNPVSTVQLPDKV